MMKILPGVSVVDTPVLNEAGLSSCNLIRYLYDPVLGGAVQKLGGWTKFFGATVAAVVRALWAWEDLNAVAHLAYGTESIGLSGSAQLGVITNGSQQDITPRSISDDVTPAASTTSGNSIVTITDATTSGVTSFDTVYIQTHLSVGGLVLFGLYECIATSSTTYSVIATDILGNPLPASSTSTTTTVAEFATTADTNIVTVTLANHGYSVDSTYPVLVSTTVGGVTLFGNYIVKTVIDADTFTILGSTNASSTATGFINGGDARFTYSIGFGAAPSGTGFGIGGFGRGGFGSGAGIVPAIGTAIDANDWTMDNWGEILIACPITGTQFQPIYGYDPLSGSPFATILSNAPPVNDGVFVAMPQRQIIAWGSTATGIQDPLLIRWCDVDNFNSWIGLPTNQAGQFRITKGSRIVGAIQGPQQGLVWTDIDLWAMQYEGLPYVYGFNEIGTGCGLIGRKAAVSYNGAVYWMGATQFFVLNADGVQPIPCTIWDVIFQTIDTTAYDKIRVAVNSRFNEIGWFYPTAGSGGEVAAYVKYNVQLGKWDYGDLARSAWIDQSVLGPPIGADPNSLYIYQHETSPDADGQPLQAAFQTGYFAMQDGEYKTFVDQLWPDAKWGTYGGAQNATLNLTFYTADYPGQTPQAYGPFALTQQTTFVTPRLRGRLVSIAVGSSDVGSFWRVGGMRYRFMPDGKF